MWQTLRCDFEVQCGIQIIQQEETKSNCFCKPGHKIKQIVTIHNFTECLMSIIIIINIITITIIDIVIFMINTVHSHFNNLKSVHLLSLITQCYVKAVQLTYL